MADFGDTVKPSPFLERIKAYRRPRPLPPVDLHLDRNEGRPPPLEVIEETTKVGTELISRYSNPGPIEQQIAEILDVGPRQVIVTSGADDAIKRILFSILAPGREMILPVPTFKMIDSYAALTGCTLIEVPWLDGSFPIDQVLEKVTDQTGLIAVVTPNTPTGLAATKSDLEQISSRAPGALLLVDLAYTEFADEDLTGFVLSLKNAVVVRSLSKAWGMAGLRVGWAAGPEKVIDWMRLASHPYTVSSISLAIAESRLSTGAKDVADFVASVRKERSALFDLLVDLKADPIRSQANFVFARVKDCEWLSDALAGLGIGVSSYSGDSPGIRITLPGDKDEFERLSNALETVLAPQAILFDIDDTLADVTESYRRATVATAEAFGASVTYDEITAAKAAGDANNDWDLTWRLIRDQGIKASLEQVTRKFEELYQGTTEKPGLRAKETLLVQREMLIRLASRIRLGVVTGRPLEDALTFLETQEIRHLFETVVTMHDAPAKPDPGPVRLALERMDIQRAWMVGDTPDDMRSARGAGVLPLGVVAPADDPDVARSALIGAGAGRILKKISEIEELLP
ncbi:MAG: aminotransferase class I/II-fold pyridoxal phosphate-dependent enzyme [Proteobacteria bacterium]|nr:aminotransferase class I/II-fold pyridoxal phosphate-dependent enzyme [Pseudomonadota bacterium]